jgi:hypothetical protein
MNGMAATATNPSFSVICIGNETPRSAQGWRKPTRGSKINISLDSAVKLAAHEAEASR